jgi:hypothetical protein
LRLAAALASWARAKNGRPAESAGVFTASRDFSLSPPGEPAARGERQHGLMMYTLPKTSGCFMAIRVAP